MSEITQEQIEIATNEIMALFDVDQPPVPIELMLERPREGLWTRADLAELTSSFLVMTDRFSPRMSVARLLARHIARCDWGKEHGLLPIYSSKSLTNNFARALMMPQPMLEDALQSGQSRKAIINRFEVPEEDFKLRLNELGMSDLE
jgi:hypothetical protein